MKRVKRKHSRPKTKQRDNADLWSILDGVYEFDLHGQLTYANAACRRMFGFLEDESLDGVDVHDLIPGKDRENSLRDIQAILRGESLVAERTFCSRDGSGFFGEIHSGPLLRGGKIVGVRGVVRDITSRKKAEAALRESEQRFRTVFELSPNAAALTVESNGEIVDINACFERITGFSKDELIGRTTTELGFYSNIDRRRFLDHLARDNEVMGLPMVFYIKNGSELHTNMFAKRMRIGKEDLILTIFHDQTHQKRLEAQFYQSQKMEAIGTLAAGIAHDFNNLLMGIQGYVSLLLSQVDLNSTLFSKLTKIENQIDKGATLTGLLLGFARRGSYDARPTDMNALVKNNIEMFGRTNKQLSIYENLQEALWPSKVDSGQIDQVLINIFVNAAQAMPQSGNLTIETSNQLLDQRKAAEHSVESGSYVRIRVRDDGCGMDPDVRQKIFEPFFTTKERGVGTGLGLASVYGIVKRHGGFITVESETGRGTTFEIFLPACEEVADANEEKPLQLRRGSGTILLVDDDEVVLDASQSMLEKLGYRVLAASGGEQAMEIYQTTKAQIDLVVLDMVMPQIDGREVFRRITDINPCQKILFSTGCDIDNDLPELEQKACQGIIHKPYAIHELSERIQQLT